MTVGSGPGPIGSVARLNWSGRPWVNHGARKTVMILMLRIERWDPRRDGPLTEAALRQKLESRGYRTSSCHLPAGSDTTVPTDSCQRVDAVVSGLMKITLDGETAILTAGDLVIVPLGAVRRVEVVGSSPVHCLEAVYSGEPA
jgi:mannose-6-phosphate isomerase-like protein (cupin superfamily)